MLQNMADHRRLVDEADDLHLAAALRAFKGIDLPDLLDALAPGSGRNLFRPGVGNVQHLFGLGVIHRGRRWIPKAPLAPLAPGTVRVPAVIATTG